MEERNKQHESLILLISNLTADVKSNTVSLSYIEKNLADTKDAIRETRSQIKDTKDELKEELKPLKDKVTGLDNNKSKLSGVWGTILFVVMLFFSLASLVVTIVGLFLKK